MPPTAGYAFTTNLAAQLVALRARLGEPYEGTSATPVNEGYFTQEDLVQFIYEAEVRLARDLVNDAITGLQTTVSRTTVDGTATYDAPATNITVADDPPVLRMVGVDLDTGSGLYPCREISRKDLWKVDDWATHRADPRHPVMVWDAAGQVTVRPTPGAEAAAAKLVFRYYKVPRRRYRWHIGVVGSASTTTILAAGATIYPDDYWITDCKSSLRMSSGYIRGQERMISDFTSLGLFTVSFAFSEAPTAGDHFLAGEVSDLGDQVGDLMLGFAAYLGRQKIGDPQQAQAFLAEYQSGVQRVNATYGGTRGGDVEVVAT